MQRIFKIASVLSNNNIDISDRLEILTLYCNSSLLKLFNESIDILRICQVHDTKSERQGRGPSTIISYFTPHWKSSFPVHTLTMHVHVQVKTFDYDLKELHTS